MSVYITLDLVFDRPTPGRQVMSVLDRFVVFRCQTLNSFLLTTRNTRKFFYNNEADFRKLLMDGG